MNIKVIDGEKYYVLPENSVFSRYYISRYDEERLHSYTYIHVPDPNDRTYYAHYDALYIHLRDDVEISIDEDGNAHFSWDDDKDVPVISGIIE